MTEKTTKTILFFKILPLVFFLIFSILMLYLIIFNSSDYIVANIDLAWFDEYDRFYFNEKIKLIIFAVVHLIIAILLIVLAKKSTNNKLANIILIFLIILFTNKFSLFKYNYYADNAYAISLLPLFYDTSIGAIIASAINIGVLIVMDKDSTTTNKVENTSNNNSKDISISNDNPKIEQEHSSNLLKSYILSQKYDQPITFVNQNKNECQLMPIGYTYYPHENQEELYVILEPISNDIEDGYYIGKYDENTDTINIIFDDYVEDVFNNWQNNLPKKQEKIKLNLKDIVISTKDWKNFKKYASQEDLLVIALGAKYQSSGSNTLIKGAVAILGCLGCIGALVACFFGILPPLMIFIIVFAYIAVNVFATKVIKYNETYNQAYSKLNTKNKNYVDNFFDDSPMFRILAVLMRLLLAILTYPYQLILMVIRVFIPKLEAWTIAKGGMYSVVISLPKGYDIAELSAVSQYYESLSFLEGFNEQMDENEKARLAKYVKYTYKDEYGRSKEAYSDDGVHFYSSPNSSYEIGTSDDKGKTINTK